jgi:hypothetical protein
VKTQDSTGKDPSETDDKNQIKKQCISLQVFHRTPGRRVREITVGERFEPQILKSFDPVTQELYRLLSATIPTQDKVDLAVKTIRQRRD